MYKFTISNASCTSVPMSGVKTYIGKGRGKTQIAVCVCVCVCVELATKYEPVNLTQNEALPNYFSHPFFTHRKIADKKGEWQQWLT